MMDSETTQAIDLIRQGNLAEGSRILSQVLNSNPDNATAWLWMSACVADNEKKIYCLQKVLAIEPANPAARKGLQALGITPPVEERQPMHPDELNAFSYRDLSAAFSSKPAQAEEAQPESTGGSFADAVRQAQANQPLPPIDEKPASGGEKAMMLEDFGFAPPPPPEPEIATEAPLPPQSLESLTPQPRQARRKKGKTNWLLGIILILLVLLLSFLVIAKFVIHVI